MPRLPAIIGGPPALRVLAVAAFTMLLAACSVMRLQAPDVMPTSVELVDAQITGQRFKVGMHVQNPNDRALPIKSVSCALEIEGVEVGRGESSAPFNVPAHGESDFDMVVTTNLAMSVPNLAMKLFRGGDMPSYRLSGTVNPDITMVPPIPFWKSGQIAPPN
jgi:LEA14-like dessication related protein